MDCLRRRKQQSEWLQVGFIKRTLREAAFKLMEGLKRPQELLVRPLSSASVSARSKGSRLCTQDILGVATKELHNRWTTPCDNVYDCQHPGRRSPLLH